jgi:hypothetical protein
VLEFLLDHHVSTEISDNDLWQPLHAAACWGHLEAVEILAQNGADITAVTRSGETPFDITEDPDIKDRLVELAEQRLRMADPARGGTGVRRGRSSAGSTRTHSIRRTSLRDKMKTTKKDVAEEGLIYMKSVTQSPSPLVNEADSSLNTDNKNNNNNKELISADGATMPTSSTPSTPSSSYTNSSSHTNGPTDVVDIADVQISLPGLFSPTPAAAVAASTKLPPGPGHGGKPVQHVAPTVKPKVTAANGPSTAATERSNGTSKTPPPPVRPARLMDRRQSSVEETVGGAGGSPGAGAAASVWASSPNVTSSSSSEPINIHVSVTINPPLLGKRNRFLLVEIST